MFVETWFSTTHSNILQACVKDLFHQWKNLQNGKADSKEKVRNHQLYIVGKKCWNCDPKIKYAVNVWQGNKTVPFGIIFLPKWNHLHQTKIICNLSVFHKLTSNFIDPRTSTVNTKSNKGTWYLPLELQMTFQLDCQIMLLLKCWKGTQNLFSYFLVVSNFSKQTSSGYLLVSNKVLQNLTA